MKFFLFFLLINPSIVVAQQKVAFTSSNLPIVVIETGSREIQSEPKINVHMGIISNPNGARNNLTDPYNEYDGLVGIETRGSSTQSFPKKSYSFETRNDDLSNRNVPLLGLPEENDWILYAPYTDKSLVRNVLAYYLSNRMGQYASRTRWCELVLNGQYQGIYVLMEKIKQDKNRVKISELGPDDNSGVNLTGGYIIKIDKFEGAKTEGWQSTFPPFPTAWQRISYQYHEPDPVDEMTSIQKDYIRNYVQSFETMMYGNVTSDPETGYQKYIDMDSFVDFIILNELGHNVDGYRLSTFLYKKRDDKGGKLYAGPIWDFNLAFGNADYYGSGETSGFQLDFDQPGDGAANAFWWKKLFNDIDFQTTLRTRWDELRVTTLQIDSLEKFIDENLNFVQEARVRNFNEWPILYEYTWPNVFWRGTFEEHVSFLKDWLADRLEWLDTNLPYGNATGVQDRPELAGSLAVYPNPASNEIRLKLGSTLDMESAFIEFYDIIGRLRLRHLIQTGNGEAKVDISALPEGAYLLHLQGPSLQQNMVLIVNR